MKKLLLATVGLLVFGNIVSADDSVKKDDSARTIAGLVAANLDSTFRYFASSVKILGEDYLNLYNSSPEIDNDQKQKWLNYSKKQKETTEFFETKPSGKIKYKANQAAFFNYTGGKFPAGTWKEFNVLRKLAPKFRVSYHTFSDSWVYLTTVKGNFLIYPYLPLKNAVNNYPPTKQIFYTAADFKNRKVGWTPPYFDLAGDGIMVTAAYPIYEGEKLLGVVSRDITLAQLSKQQLQPFNENDDLYCLLINKQGLAIAVSDLKTAKVIADKNTSADEAITYFRTVDGMKKDAIKGQISENKLFDQAVEKILTEIKKQPQKDAWQAEAFTEIESYQVNAQKLKTTGWIVVVVKAN